MKRWISVAILLAPLLGCSSARVLVASPEDYERYREVRLEHSFLGRLSAAWRYLAAEPEGAFRPQVERWFERADERFLARHWDDASNLRRYVEALSDAPRVGLARARLETLAALRQGKVDEERTFLEQEAQRQRDFDAAKEARGAFVRTVMDLVHTAAASPDFGKPKDEWTALSGPLFEADPRATCSPELCQKRLLLSFEIPRHDGLETRAVVLELRAELQNGRLRAVEFAAPALFDRVAEAATARPSDPGDLQARAEAIGVSTQLLDMALSAGFSDPACQEEAVSPVVIARACKGLRARVIAAETEGEPDRVRVERAP